MMERSEDINELAAALSKAQGEMTPVAKDAKGQVGKVKTKYATLDAVIETVRKPLANNGLSFTQMLDGENLITMLIHSSGQWMSSSSVIAKMGRNNSAISDVQVLGGSITYMKRYMLSAMLGISTDEDTDGSNTARQQQRRPQSVQQRNPAPKTEAEPVKGGANWLADNALRNTPEQLRGKFETNISHNVNFQYQGDERKGKLTSIRLNLEKCFDDDKPNKRHVVTHYLTGKQSTNELTDGEIRVIHSWLDPQTDENGQWGINAESAREARAIVPAALEAAGQTNLFDGDTSAF